MPLNKNMALASFVLLATWCVDVHAVDSMLIRRQAKRILSDPSFQKKLLLSPSSQPAAHGCGGNRVVEKTKSGTSGGMSFFTLIAWLGVGLAIAMVAIWIAAFIRRKNPQDDTGDDSESDIRSSGQHVELEQAQHLASLERFAEAVHRILLLTVSQMAEKKGRVVSSWTTSRELSVMLPSGREEREAFCRMVQTVETGLFAGRQLERSDYERCLNDYMQLVGDA